MPRRNLAWLVGIACFSLFTWTLAQAGFPPHGPLQFVKGMPGFEDDYEGVNLLVQGWRQVKQNYVEEVDKKKGRAFWENALQGGLQSLDVHSAYINPKEYEHFKKQSEAEFGGIGVSIRIHPETKKPVVISPMVGTPAYRAGIKAGDEIEKIEGDPTQGMLSQDVVDKIQGTPGTPVRLTIRHRGSDQLEDLTLTRSRIEIESVLGDQRDADKQWDFMIDKERGIAYIRIVQFTQKTSRELKHALDKLQDQGVKGIILDFRNNPGGLLGSAVDVANLFLPAGKRIVGVEGRTHPSEVKDAKQGGMLLPNKPLVVLIDSESASASEIVAAALQDNQSTDGTPRAVIVGERSFGKGSVQNLIPMDNGKSAIKLTTAKYVRPNGKNMHRFTSSKPDDDWGVRPDITVKLTPLEEAEYWSARQDRDIVRDDQAEALETRRRLAMLVAPVGPVGAAWAMSQPMGVLAASVEVAVASHNTPKSAKPFVDKVLNQAVDHLRDKLKS